MRIDFKDMSKIVGETWRTLTSKERAPYEKQARAETLQYEEERRIFEKKHKIWADLQHKAKASGQLNHAPLLVSTAAVLNSAAFLLCQQELSKKTILTTHASMSVAQTRQVSPCSVVLYLTWNFHAGFTLNQSSCLLLLFITQQQSWHILVL